MEGAGHMNDTDEFLSFVRSLDRERGTPLRDLFSKNTSRRLSNQIVLCVSQQIQQGSIDRPNRQIGIDDQQGISH